MSVPTGATGTARLRAEPELCAKLARLVARREPGAGEEAEFTQARADMMLARIAWSRIVEPGDGIAGAVLSALGAQNSLRLLIEGASAKEFAALMREAGAELAQRSVGEAMARWRPRLDRTATTGDVDRALAARLRAVVPHEECWPGSFTDLGAHAPVMLWTRGDPGLLVAPALSVVGARAATGYGSHITAEIVDEICRAGLTIVSGAAYGIDAVAHRTALAADAPTVAVLAGGADRAYPAAHDSLLARIGRDGLVCAEMIPGATPTKWRFRMRNRLIAALSPATLVTEAGVRSGTLNTAGHAATMGRALGAVPGPVTSAASAGCHLLIREYDATLITNARDACEMLGIEERNDVPDEQPAGSQPRTSPVHERILDALPLRGAREAAEIARRAGVSVVEARDALAELELLGRVRRREGAEAVPADAPLRWSLQR